MHRTEGYSVCRLRCVSLGALCISSFLLMSHMSYLQICLSIWTQTVKFAWWDSIRENDTLHCCWGLFYALGTRQSCHLSFLALRNWVALLKQHVDDRQPTNRHCPNEAVLFSIPHFPLLSLSSCCSLRSLFRGQCCFGFLRTVLKASAWQQLPDLMTHWLCPIL